jgi:hypothetical protein
VWHAEPDPTLRTNNDEHYRYAAGAPKSTAPWKIDSKSFGNGRAITKPIAKPTAATFKPWTRIMRRMSPALAPRASRIPISPSLGAVTHESGKKVVCGSAVGHGALKEIHTPRTPRGIGSRRPVPIRLETRERMAPWQRRIALTQIQ